MNNNILQKAIAGLKEGLNEPSLRETKIVYVLGMLETLVEIQTSLIPIDIPKWPSSQGKAEVIKALDEVFDKQDEGSLLDAKARASLATIKSMGGTTE